MTWLAKRVRSHLSADATYPAMLTGGVRDGLDDVLCKPAVPDPHPSVALHVGAFGFAWFGFVATFTHAPGWISGCTSEQAFCSWVVPPVPTAGLGAFPEHGTCVVRGEHYSSWRA